MYNSDGKLKPLIKYFTFIFGGFILIILGVNLFNWIVKLYTSPNALMDLESNVGISLFFWPVFLIMFILIGWFVYTSKKK